jgi:proline iminopeptidase
LDLSAPLVSAWELARAWPDAELTVIDDSGHTGSPAMAAAVRQAISRFTDGDLAPG